MPPKAASKKKTAAVAESSTAAHIPTLGEQLSYLWHPRPFKNPYYTKNTSRRAKNLKTVLSQERERERVERERKRLERLEREANGAMEVDGADDEEMPTYSSIEAPPSLLPQKHYCDITGLEAPYTDPVTGLRYHDKTVYELIRNMSPGVAKDYLAARGIAIILK